MKINGKEFGDLFLAPMAGVSEVGFRHVCKMAGADLTYTEMVNSKALIYDSAKTKEMLITSDIEDPKVVQIFGHDPKTMAEACKLDCLSKFDLIDINFGCPAPKIVGNNDGSAILKDLPLLKQIVEECVKATNKPISCKFRKGYHADDNVACEVAKICEDAGAKLITIHGRTKTQMYSGVSDLETIAKVKASVKIPVVGNGDVTNLESYNKMKLTGVDAVMIGRGALGNPNLFNIIKGKPCISKLELIKKHIEVLRQHYEDIYINIVMRKHFLWYVAGEENARNYKLDLANSESIEKSLQILEKILN